MSFYSFTSFFLYTDLDVNILSSYNNINGIETEICEIKSGGEIQHATITKIKYAYFLTFCK